MGEGLATAEALAEDTAAAQISALKAQIESVFLGKTECIELTLVALLARGHVLLEDVPGVGKTTLARALAASTELGFQRIQFTSDLLPSDLVGVSIFREDTRQFEFKPGPVFTQMLLADEINRATPRTQSALLEAMNEEQVTVDDTTHALEAPFMVLATQNPLEFAGTYPLPESQMDRFMLRISIGYPARGDETDVIRRYSQSDVCEGLAPVLSRSELLALQGQVAEVQVADEVMSYAMDLIEATRNSEQLVLGASTRGAMALFRAVQALALLRGRDHAVPNDVKVLAVPVLAHRVLGVGSEGGSGRVTEAVIEDLLETIPVPA
jgi:MoxR-like ATPase